MTVFDSPPIDTTSTPGTTPPVACVRPDTFFDGERWRCRGCTWSSPRSGIPDTERGLGDE
jgi:hypothetical protein